MKKLLLILFLFLDYVNAGCSNGLISISEPSSVLTSVINDRDIIKYPLVSSETAMNIYNNTYSISEFGDGYDCYTHWNGSENIEYCKYPSETKVFTCVLPLVCDDNQTANYSVNPPFCKDNIPPLDCPANSVPSADNLSCECVSPYVSDSNGTGCILPPSIPDENSTKPNGDCQPGFAKNSLGVCKQDSDGDRVPDDEDKYPHDGSKSGGGDNGKVYCKRKINDCTPNCECPAGTLNLLGYISLCVNFKTGAQHTGKFCDVDGNGDEPTDPNAPKDCGNPSSIFNYSFQVQVASDSLCYDLRRRYADGGVIKGFNYTCPDETIACYYNLASDNNNSVSNNNPNPDNNTSNPLGENNNTNPTNDSNTSSNFDTMNLENKLDSIKDLLSSDGSINNSLQDIGSLVSNASGKNHDDLSTINDSVGSLGSKLDGIKSAIESQTSTPATDMTETNTLLTDLNDKLSDREEGRGELDSEHAAGENVLKDALLSFSTLKNDMINLSSGLDAPTVHSSGDCFLSGTTKNIGSFKFDFSTLSSLRLPLSIFLNFFLLYITIRFYIIIARDIALHISNI